VVDQDELDGLPGDDVEASDRELAMAEQLIGALSTEFDPSKYHDEYREQLLALIDEKANGATVVTLPERPAAANNVTDLMAALEASIAAAKQARAS
jgi:DNA end-binding protein Ku